LGFFHHDQIGWGQAIFCVAIHMPFLTFNSLYQVYSIQRAQAICCVAIYMTANMLDRRVRRSKRPIDRPDMPRQKSSHPPTHPCPPLLSKIHPQNSLGFPCGGRLHGTNNANDESLKNKLQL
jgi:hypothetical protein